MSFNKFQESIKFELNNAHTFDVVKGKFGGYTIHLDLDLDDDGGCYYKLHQLFIDHFASNKLYGTTLYLKTKMLSAENKEKLLNKGNQDILIHFEATGIYTNNEKRYVIFEITKLCTRDA